jgi:hypothetical protein
MTDPQWGDFPGFSQGEDVKFCSAMLPKPDLHRIPNARAVREPNR